MKNTAISGLNELPPPPQVVGNFKATEVLRCWISDDNLQVSLAPLVFSKNAETWGLLLADVARHIAQSFDQEGVHNYDDALQRIRSQLDIEWQAPTGTATTEDLKKQ